MSSIRDKALEQHRVGQLSAERDREQARQANAAEKRHVIRLMQQHGHGDNATQAGQFARLLNDRISGAAVEQGGEWVVWRELV